MSEYATDIKEQLDEIIALARERKAEVKDVRLDADEYDLPGILRSLEMVEDLLLGLFE